MTVAIVMFCSLDGSADDLILTLPGDAQSASMSEAVTASVSGAPAIFSNPAGLSRVDVGSLSVMHTAYLESISYSTLAASLPFGFHNAVGMGVSYLSFGSVPSYDSSGVLMPSYAPKDTSVRLGVAKSFFHTSVGASLFYLQSKILDSASTYGMSLGVHQIWGPFAWGAALENAGAALSYGTQSHPLPTQERLGVSVHLLPAWMVNLDAVKPTQSSPWFALGNEFRWDFSEDLNLSVRGGYNTRDSGAVPGLGGLSAGAGFGWKESALQYAWVPFGDLGQTHRLSFEVYFGANPGGSTSEREHRQHGLLTSRWESTRRLFGQPKAIKAAMKMPVMPWKKTGPGWRTAKDKMMTLLAQDALCSNTGARALLTRTVGTVVLKTSGPESRWPRLRSGQYLFEGDTVHTYANATADVLFANGTQAQVGSDSVLTVETKDAICDLSVTRLEKGQVFMSSQNGKTLRIETPLGAAAVENSEARLNVDGQSARMRVQKGVGSFLADDILTPVQEHTTFTKSAKGRTAKINQIKDVDEPVAIAPADPENSLGRWDPAYAKKLQNEIMRLDSIPGLKLGEYIRDVTLRTELKLRVYDMRRRQEEIRQQQVGMAGDVQQFSDLRKSLSVVPDDEEPKSMRDRLKSLKQATRVLVTAQRRLVELNEELKESMHDTRADQEYLAAMPIVRMLNITADDATVPFESGRAVLSERALQVLDTIAESMSTVQPYRVVIEGHTDQDGSKRANELLSKQRAEAVAMYLRRKSNLPARLFITKGRGATQPLETDGSQASLEKNRRVEIWFELRGL
jgi:outer membrane protein OmpA-like peptidoglycan-associated protein